MEINSLANFQRQVLEQFREHSASITSHVARVYEEYGPGPDELGGGDLLQLDLIPSESNLCRFSASVGDGIASVTVGRGALDFNCRMSRDEESWPDEIEQYLIDVLSGRIKEIEWRLGAIQLQLDTLRRDDSGQWVHLHSWGFPFLRPVFRILAKYHFIVERVRAYEPYSDEHRYEH